MSVGNAAAASDLDASGGRDWPQWRYDAGRSARSPHGLPSELRLAWTRRESSRTPTWDDPLNNDLMSYDRIFEPIVVGHRMIVGFNDQDMVLCCDLRTGSELWRFTADGPIRLPAASWRDRVYFVSDDGFLYCVDVSDGHLHWRHQGGPTSRKVLGNGRVISNWPARGGPVVHGDTVYFAAGIWPFMGTFLYALHAESGEVKWANDGTSASYIKQPHSAPAFAGVAPQGTLVATSDYLVVPGGRSIPAVFDRQSGKLVHFLLNAGGKATGGSFVVADDHDFYVHTRMRGVRKFDLKSGVKTEWLINEPVLGDDYVYTAAEGQVQALRADKSVAWSLPVDGSGDLIQAGRHLYAAGTEAIDVIAVPDDAGAEPTIVQRLATTGRVMRLVAGSDSLLAVTAEGEIDCYRADAPDRPRIHDGDVQPQHTAGTESTSSQLAEFLRQHQADVGYAFVFGALEAELLDDLVVNSQLHIVVVDDDLARVDGLRRRFTEQRMYGRRIVIHYGTPHAFQAPPYMAQLVIVGSSFHDRFGAAGLRVMFESVRPYGGLFWFPQAHDRTAWEASLASAGLSQASLHASGENGPYAQRDGALPGSAPWTHLYGNIANTVKSDDARVKAPLGVLWFGGNSHEDVLPRHSHGPCEQVVGGRLFVEGINSLTARDVYTGRVIWRREFPDLGTAGIYYDESYADTPLDPAYNQLHIPGANARGANFVATSDQVYIAIADECHVLNAATGATERNIRLPDRTGVTESDEASAETIQHDVPQRWTYLGVYGDQLLGGTGFGDYATRYGYQYEASRKRGTAWSPEWFGSRGVVALDRTRGEPQWQFDARYSFLHNGIVAGNGTVFLLDKLPQSVEDQMARRGQSRPSDYRLLALDAATGAVRWERTDDVFGTWLSYSEEHDILVMAGSAAPDRATDETGQGITALRGKNGEVVWQNPDLRYVGPCILHHALLFTNSRSYLPNSGVFNLLDGTPHFTEDPFTGAKQPWQFLRSYGCNTAVASEHLLTFRSGAAGYYDLHNQCGVANLGGFRSGCSSNLIAADGVLNAPDFTRTCSCGYQNQTSLALVHFPDTEIWSVSPSRPPQSLAQRVQRVGINFGAPGSRRAENGTVWIEYPSVADPPLYPLGIELTGDAVSYYRRHSSVPSGTEPWIVASGVEGVQRLRLSLLGPIESDAARFTLRLLFAQPDRSPPRRFHVEVQGATRLVDLGAQLPATESWRQTEIVLHDVRAESNEIELQFTPRDDDVKTLLSGVELTRE